MLIIKKDGTKEPFKAEKIINAVKKSSKRVMIDLKESDFDLICQISKGCSRNCGC